MKVKPILRCKLFSVHVQNAETALRSYLPFELSWICDNLIDWICHRRGGSQLILLLYNTTAVHQEADDCGGAACRIWGNACGALPWSHVLAKEAIGEGAARTPLCQ